ncbi:DUF2971 domain-containing protein [Pseudomonas neustonica]|uniref:DUF2971 domain-containing protein n=1 Tax=Pseudomonas neustonica TaxID=2487346 RepID=UPI003F44F9FE
MRNGNGRLYRIMSFHHVVQLLEQRELFFAHPSTWEDPYETRLIHQQSHKVYSQCWCSIGASDAMWRIYSPNHLGVRISTSTKKLRQALDRAKRSQDFEYRVGDVSYLKQFALNQKTKIVHEELASSFSLEKAIDLLYLKRVAFDHEAEYRAVIMCPNARPEDVVSGYKVKVNPNTLIDSILIDPRAPNELAEALIYYLKEKVGFKKRVERSVLYKTPRALVVEL